jgi:hypothetical protein
MKIKQISVLLLLTALIACRKNNSPYLHTYDLNGSHTWTGTFHSYSPTYPPVDTTLTVTRDYTITVLDEQRIVIETDTLKLTEMNETMKKIVFSKTVRFVSSGFYSTSVTWNYGTRIADYYFNSGGKLGSQWEKLQAKL